MFVFVGIVDRQGSRGTAELVAMKRKNEVNFRTRLVLQFKDSWNFIYLYIPHDGKQVIYDEAYQQD